MEGGRGEWRRVGVKGRGVEESGGEWKRVEGSRGEQRRVEGEGRGECRGVGVKKEGEWRRVEGSGREWMGVEESGEE